MHLIAINNLTHPLEKPILVKYCVSFFCRLRGLTFRHSLPPDQGLLLVQSQDSRLNAAIHMLGVWFDLAVIWINSNEIVVDLQLARRWRPAYIPRQPARYILELSADRLNDFHPGDHVKIAIPAQPSSLT